MAFYSGSGKDVANTKWQIRLYNKTLYMSLSIAVKEFTMFYSNIKNI